MYLSRTSQTRDSTIIGSFWYNTIPALLAYTTALGTSSEFSRSLHWHCAVIVPGQVISWLQSLDSVSDPVQLAPPWTASRKIPRWRIWTPLMPQVSEQSPHESHIPHTQSSKQSAYIKTCLSLTYTQSTFLRCLGMAELGICGQVQPRSQSMECLHATHAGLSF